MQPNDLSLFGEHIKHEWWLLVTSVQNDGWKHWKFQKFNGSHPSWTRSDVDFLRTKSRGTYARFFLSFLRFHFQLNMVLRDTDLFLNNPHLEGLVNQCWVLVPPVAVAPEISSHGKPLRFWSPPKKDMNHLPSTDSQGRLVSFREVLCIGFFSGNHGKIRSSSHTCFWQKVSASVYFLVGWLGILLVNNILAPLFHVCSKSQVIRLNNSSSWDDISCCIF